MIRKKICLLGAAGVGKTSLARRYVESIFDERYLTTIGVRIDKKIVDAGGREVTLMIWDLAGEDALAQVRMSHLRGAEGFLLVVDGTRLETLAIARDLEARVRGELGALPFLLLANKCDLGEEWKAEDGLTEAERAGWRVLRTSAKTGEGVEWAFRELVFRMLG